MKTAALFPGQGSEYPGMLKPIRNCQITRDVFSKINDVAGRNILGIAVEGSEEELRPSLTAQLSVFGTSVCYWHLLDGQSEIAGLAGHSLGFYSALYAAGVLTLDDCLNIIRMVHEIIEKKGPGLMAALFGIRVSEAEKICSDIGNVYVSHINSATQIVLSGTAPSVKEACKMALQTGALDAKELSIPHPLHSPLMQGIESDLRPFIDTIDIGKPGIPIMSHLDSTVLDRDSIAGVICGQLSRTVRWRDAVRSLSDVGMRRFLEVGPSDVLSKLVRWIDRDAGSTTAEEALDCQTV